MKKILTFVCALALAAASCSDDDKVGPDDGNGPGGETASEIVLNEINGNGEDSAKFIEIFNGSASEVSLRGYTVYYNNFGSEPALAWTGTDETIPAGGILLLQGTKNTSNPSHALSTGLSGTQGIVVDLRDATGATVDIFSVGPDDERASTFARIPDGSQSWYYDQVEGTPGTTNGTDTGKLPIVTLPVITEASLSPARPTSGSRVTLSAVVRHAYGTELDVVAIQWTLNDEEQDDITMNPMQSLYSASIPAQPMGSVVEYSIAASTREGGISTVSGRYTVSTGEISSTGQVYINECDPADKVWELYNSENYAVDLSGWQMLKDNGDGTFTFGEGTVIEAGGFLLLTRNADGSPTFGMSQTSGFRYDLIDIEGNTVDVFDNYGDNQINGNIAEGHTLARVGDGGSLIATFSSGSIGESNSKGTPYDTPVVYMAGGWRTPAVPAADDPVTVKANITYHEAITSVTLRYRIGTATEQSLAMMSSNEGRTWTGIIPAVGAEADVSYYFEATPGGTAVPDENTFTVTATAVDYGRLVLNEIDGNHKFVEIYNLGQVALPLAGVSLLKDEQTVFWTGQGTSSIEPGGYYTIVRSGEEDDDNGNASEFTGAAGISAKKNLKFELRDPDGNVVDEFVRTNGGAWNDDCSPDYSKSGDGGKYSFSRCPDGTGEFGLALPSCNSANPATAAGPIVTS